MLTQAELTAAEQGARRRLQWAALRRRALAGRTVAPWVSQAVEDAAEQAMRDLLAAQSLLALRTTYAEV